jgi:hypothetical protein
MASSFAMYDTIPKEWQWKPVTNLAKFTEIAKVSLNLQPNAKLVPPRD